MQFSITCTFIILLSTVYALPPGLHTVSQKTKNSVPSKDAHTPGITRTEGRNALLTSSASILGGGALIGASVAALMHNYPAGASKRVHDTFDWDTQKEDNAILGGASIEALRHSRPAAALKTFDETSSLHTLNEEDAIASNGSLPRIISSNGKNGKTNRI